MLGSVRTGTRGAAGAGGAATGAGGATRTGAGGGTTWVVVIVGAGVGGGFTLTSGGGTNDGGGGANLGGGGRFSGGRRRRLDVLDDLGLDRRLDHLDHALRQAGHQRPAQQHVQGHHDAETEQVPARVALLLGEIHSTSPVDPAHVGRKALQKITTTAAWPPRPDAVEARDYIANDPDPVRGITLEGPGHAVRAAVAQ